MGSDKMVRALRTVALLLRSERIGVGRPMSLLALLVICVSLFFCGALSRLKKQGEQ